MQQKIRIRIVPRRENQGGDATRLSGMYHIRDSGVSNTERCIQSDDKIPRNGHKLRAKKQRKRTQSNPKKSIRVETIRMSNIKGYYTESVYMGWYNGSYRPFATEKEYTEIVEEEEEFARILEQEKAKVG